MTENVVYILGAGFSAPLGLPLVSNFITKSKDLYAADPKKCASFSSIFSSLDKMAKIKNFFSADLSNIEEVLSILEMDTSLGGDPSLESFSAYIAGVIEGLTPMADFDPVYRDGRGDFESHVPWRYGLFVASLLQVTWSFNGRIPLFSQRLGEYRYHVISLNYDLVLESVVAVIRDTYKVDLELQIKRPTRGGLIDPDNCVALCKLHGSIDGPAIVPPTWNKTLREGIVPEWETALNLLSKANHIRFMGYSLPPGDAYFRYLLKAGVLRSSHLKTLDVLCLDPSCEVFERFNAFVDFPSFRFKNGRTEEYLKGLISHFIFGNSTSHNVLEEVHQSFFQGTVS
jgi:hypothetical protein